MSQTAEILRLNPGQPEGQEWENKIDLIRRTVAAGASADELELFFHQARRAGLDPLAKQIYFVKRQGKGVVQVGIDGLFAIAHRTGACAGIDDAEFTGTTERGFPAAARVAVYRMVQGQRCPFVATARWDEYFPGDQQGFQWKRMPHTMLAKCATALALRKAFPAEMSGYYVPEEMDQAGVPDEIDPKTNGGATGNAGTVSRDARKNPQESASGAPGVTALLSPFNGDSEPELQGQAPVEATKDAFTTNSNPPTSGDGQQAFGYAPMRWATAKMFGEPATDSQRKMARNKARERMLDLEEIDVVRRLVLKEYRLEDDGTKATMSLFVDWLMNADDESLDKASAAAEAEPGPEKEQGS